MDNIRFRGVMPALVTPFDDGGRIKCETVRRLMDMQLSNGVSGFYICGNTGEGPVLSAKTRMDMAETVMEHIKGRGAVIDHIGASNIQDTLALARHAARAGVDAISSVAPTFFYNYTDDEIVDYYKAIADVTDTPMIVYATGLMRSPDITRLIARLMKIPGVVGVKFTRTNYFEMRKIKELNGGNINVINGPDETLLCGLVMGADAGIGSTYNIMPAWFARLYRSFVDGDYDTAREYQYRIDGVIDVLLRYGVNGVINSTKCTLELMGFDVGQAAFPAKRFSASEREALKADLAAAGLAVG